jgi:putative MATE family efflux protein
LIIKEALQQMNKDLTVGSPKKVLLKFCIPLLGSIIFQQLYNIADSLVAGKFINENALAAVGNSYEITLVYIAIAFGCNIGCSVVIARFFGAKQYKDMKTAVSTTFIASAVLCVILTILGFIFAPSLLRLINTPPKIFDDCLLYLNIYIGGVFFLMFYNIATGMFSAMGDSKTPFYFLAVSSVANVLVDILFVKSFKMGVAGVAWATFICQGVSCILAMLAIMRRLRTIETDVQAPLFSWHILKNIVIISIPSILQQSCISIGNIVIQSIINGFGESVIAGYAAAVKLNNLVTTSFVALGNGMSNFTSQNIGAGKPDRVKSGFIGGLIMVLVLAVPIVALYFFASREVTYLFMETRTGTAIETGIDFLRIVSPFYFIVSIKIMADGVLRGSGAMTCFMVTTFTDLILRVIFAFIFSDAFGVIGVWYAWPVGWVVSTASSVFFYLRGKWKNKSLV